MYTRGNNLPFMNNELSKAITNRARLRDVYLRKRSDENRKSTPNNGITAFHY